MLSLANQSSDASGGYAFPAAGTNFSLPVDGVAYLNVTGTDCIPTPARPSGRIIRRQSYYGFRPARTYMYGEFDHRTWTAYVGMGNETSGVALAGEEGCLCFCFSFITLGGRQHASMAVCSMSAQLYSSLANGHGPMCWWCLSPYALSLQLWLRCSD